MATATAAVESTTSVKSATETTTVESSTMESAITVKSRVAVKSMRTRNRSGRMEVIEPRSRSAETKSWMDPSDKWPRANKAWSNETRSKEVWPDESRREDYARREESPTEGAINNAGTGNKRVVVKPRIPIPAGTNPAV